MANSSDVTAGNDALASQYNNLRKDVLDTSTGHTHNGTDSKNLGDVSPTKVTTSGFTTLGTGAPVIKMKKLTGATHVSEGSSTSIAHVVDASKIISVTAMVENVTDSFISPEFSRTGGHQFSLSIVETNIVITNSAANSSNILSKPIIVTIIYEE